MSFLVAMHMLANICDLLLHDHVTLVNHSHAPFFLFALLSSSFCIAAAGSTSSQMLLGLQSDGSSTDYMHRRAPPIQSKHFDDQAVDLVAAG